MLTVRQSNLHQVSAIQYADDLPGNVRALGELVRARDAADVNN